MRKGGGSPLRVPCHTALFCLSLVKSQQAVTGIQQLLGHQRPTTSEYLPACVAPNLDYLAGVIEGAVGDVAIPVTGLRRKGRLYCEQVKRAGCFAAARLFLLVLTEMVVYS